MIINEDYFDDIKIKDDDIVNEPEIVQSEEEKDLSSYKTLRIEYDHLQSFDDCLKQLKILIKIAEAVIENTQLFNKSVIRVYIDKYSANNHWLDSISFDNITSKNYETKIKELLKKTKCRVNIILNILFKPPVIDFKKFCDDMYIMYVRLLKNYKIKNISIAICAYSYLGSIAYKFFDFYKIRQMYRCVYDIDLFTKDIDLSGFDERTYNRKYSCSGKMPYIENLIKLSNKPDLFKEYTLDIKGYAVHSQQRDICIGLIPKSDEYKKTGLMLDFIYKIIINRFTSFDFYEFSTCHDSVRIWVLMDFDNTEPTNSKYLKGQDAYHVYYDYRDVRVTVSLINNDYRLIDYQTHRLMPYHAFTDSEIERMEERFKRDMNINS